jgi:hypothetical protein
MLFEQKVVLRNVFIVKTGDSNIEQNIEQKREIEKGEIHSIGFVAHKVLYGAVDTKNPKRLYEQVEGKQ